MSQNFDCTQMISFDRSLIANLSDDLFQDIERLGFSLVLDENIRNVKKEYFFSQENEYFIEFSNECFCGEFEDWYELNEPPQLISDFCNALISCANKNQIDSMKVYLSFFAEKGYSSDHYSDSNFNDLLKTLFLMSTHNFDVWTDNLIININKLTLVRPENSRHPSGH